MLEALSPLGTPGDGIGGGEGAIYLWARLPPGETPSQLQDFLIRTAGSFILGRTLRFASTAKLLAMGTPSTCLFWINSCIGQFFPKIFLRLIFGQSRVLGQRSNDHCSRPRGALQSSDNVEAGARLTLASASHADCWVPDGFQVIGELLLSQTSVCPRPRSLFAYRFCR